MILVTEADYKPPGPDPFKVRLVEFGKGGVTMQVLVGNAWLPICTLNNDGTLGLWDVQNERLSEVGFNMKGRAESSFGSFISTHIQ